MLFYARFIFFLNRIFFYFFYFFYSLCKAELHQQASTIRQLESELRTSQSEAAELRATTREQQVQKLFFFIFEI